MLDGKVKLPGVGEVSKKVAVGGAIGVAGIIMLAYIRRARNASTTNANPAGGTAAAAAGSTDLQTDPAGNTCAAVDPSSGYCPGSSQDQAYQAEQASYYGGDAGDLSGGDESEDGYGGLVSNPGYTEGASCIAADGSTGVYDSLGNCIPTGVTTTTGGGTGGTETADQWVIATAAMIPGDAATFETAAAKIFAGLTVTTAQKDLFLEGVGLNPLPAGVTYPTPIKTSDTSGHPAPPASKKAVPNVVGKRAEDAGSTLKAAGFKSIALPGTPKGKKGTITDQHPKAGAMATTGSTVTLVNKIS